MRGHNRRFPVLPKGLTLIELLVSIAILVVMILAFSTIIVQSQRFVSASRAARRSQQLAGSIARVVRDDFRRATQDGFFAIKAPTGGAPRMVFTTAGISNSLTQSVTGTGSIVCYGQVANQASANTWILWRPAFVLQKGVSGTVGTIADDIYNYDMTQIMAKTRTDMNAIANQFAALTPSISLPVSNISQIGSLWQALGQRCSWLSICWTDGSTDTNKNLRWHGVFATGENQWTIPNPQAFTPAAGIVTGDAGYSCLWTHHDQSLWPKAVRIRFRITDPMISSEFRGKIEGGTTRYVEYEVVCTLGQ